MTTTNAATQRTRTTVDRLLDGLASGAGPDADIFAGGVVLDATVPGWRFQLTGAERVTDKLTEWFPVPGTYDEVRRWPTPDGEVVEYTFSWLAHGAPIAVHHVHVLDLDAEGRIVADRFWCGGQWGAALLAEMQEAQQAADAATGP